MTIREALDEKRKEYAGKVRHLVLCKYELFYLGDDGILGVGHSDDTVYPVSLETAQKEAEFFGCEFSEE